jgi:ABC-2 type transport system permease protein
MSMAAGPGASAPGASAPGALAGRGSGPGGRAGPGPLAGAGALTRLGMRRDRVMLAVWVYLLTILVVSTGYSFKGLYKTPASRGAVYAGVAHDPATLALAGPIYGTSLGALTAYKVGVACAVLASLMSMFIVIRHTRADEEAGRLELVGSTAVGRNAPLAAGLLLAAAANAAAVLLIIAAQAVIGYPAGGSAALALAIGSAGLLSGAVAAVAAQLSGSARGARGIGICAIVAADLLMSIGAAAGTSGSLRWMLWLSPLGWASEVRPYAGDRWLVLILPLAAAVAVAAAAALMATRRDLDAGLVPPRPGPAHASRLLRGPLALAWRQQRASLAGWAVGAAAYAAAFGSVAGNIGSFLGSGTGVRKAIARLGGQPGITNAYLAAVMTILGLVVAGYAVSLVLRLRADETAERAEPLLATATSRVSWAGGQLVVAASGSAVVLGMAGLGAGLAFGARAGDPGAALPRLLGAAFAQLPAVLVTAAVATALFGLLPGSCEAASWTALGLAALLALFGPTLQLAQWVQDISPFSHVPKLPGGTVSAAALAWLSAVAVVLAAAGLLGLRRRDIG